MKFLRTLLPVFYSSFRVVYDIGQI